MRNSEHTETERLQAAADLGKRFIQRWDLYSRQLPDGSYVCVRKPLTAEDLLSHLDGRITLGTYIMDKESNVRFAALDADEEKSGERVLEVAKKLGEESVPTYPELSRRGAHLWFFFENPMPAEHARRFVKGILTVNDLGSVEIYPKQDKTTDDGPGSLIRLPFGVHRKSGQRYPFVDAYGVPIAGSIREQIRILANAQTVPDVSIMHYAGIQSEKAVNGPYKQSGKAIDASWEKVKEEISVMDFVGRYIDLRPTVSGAVGKCPFHEDDHVSFGVNAKGNYWNCFAGCGSGSIIDFWMKWKGIGFPQAVTELKEFLGG